MAHPRQARALRITWTAFWGIAALLLIALWVRSYWRLDCVRRTDTRLMFTSIFSNSGTIEIYRADTQQFPDFADAPSDWEYETRSSIKQGERFRYQYDRSQIDLRVSIWLPSLLLASIAIAPWIRLSYSFSLRTLLVAITLIAVGLGLVVWSMH
jgi:hypothetical protein